LLCISCCQSIHRQILILKFSATYERRTCPVKLDGYWLLYWE
jgi:hypothetical protein